MAVSRTTEFGEYGEKVVDGIDVPVTRDDDEDVIDVDNTVTIEIPLACGGADQTVSAYCAEFLDIRRNRDSVDFSNVIGHLQCWRLRHISDQAKDLGCI